MAVPSTVKLRVILCDNNSQRLALPNGIPESVDDLTQHIKNQCGLESDIRLQFMDPEFGNEFNNLTSTSDIQDKSTIKIIFNSLAVPGGPSPPPYSNSPPPPYSSPSPSNTSSSLPSTASADTEILSSPEDMSSRSSGWPLVFVVPRFPYDTQLELAKANATFKETGAFLDPSTKLKSSILDGLMEEIVKYKVYLSDAEFTEVAHALVSAHPSLKEPGSFTGYDGWKMSLKYKLATYRTKLRRLGCPEVSVNSLTNNDGCSPAYGVKKPRKAEVNFCPPYPAGETEATQELKRVALLSELEIRNNEAKVAELMDQTFSKRRQEIVQDAPLIVELKTRWPALFNLREVCAEFRRITTVNLQAKFFSQLDGHTTKLVKAFGKRGGIVGHKLKSILAPMGESDDIDVRRYCVLKGLCAYFKEDPGKLIKEYMSDDPNTQAAMAETVHGIYVIRHEGAEPDEPPEDVGVILEGVPVLRELRNVPLAMAIFLAFVYALNLCYPPELKYTFEALQKVFLELNGNRLSTKVQALKTILSR